MKHVGGVLLFLCCVLLGSRLGSCAQALNPTENTVLEAQSPLQVVDSSIDIHVVGLSGFPAQAKKLPPNAKSPPAGPNSNNNNAVTDLDVDQVEKVTGYVKFAVVTVAFDKPVFLSRDTPNPFGNANGKSANPNNGTSSLFFSSHNTTFEKFGSIGLTRLICGAKIFDSHPSVTQDNSPPRFLVPADHLSLFVPEVPAIASALPWLQSCGGRGGFPSAHQASFVLLLAHSRAGEAGSVILADTELASCRLSFLPKTSQSWRPHGTFASPTGVPFTQTVKIATSALRSAPPPIASPAYSLSTSSSSSSVASREDQLALERVRRQRRETLCWGASQSLYRPLRSSTAATSVFSPAKAKEAFLEEVVNLQPSSNNGGDGGSRLWDHSPMKAVPVKGMKNAVVTGLTYRQESSRQHGWGMVGLSQKDRSIYDVMDEASLAMLEESSTVTAAETSPYGGSAAAADNNNNSNNNNNNQQQQQQQQQQQRQEPSVTSRTMARTATEQLVGSLVLHAEPWSLSLLELGTVSTSMTRTGTGNLMMGILSGLLSPIISPLTDLIGGVVGNDIGNALGSAIADHTTQGVSQQVIDGLEPMLTGEVVQLIVPALTEAITDEVIDVVSRTVAELVAKETAEPITSEVAKRLAFSLIPRVVNDIVPMVATGAVMNMTRAVTLVLPRSLAHSIVPALTLTLTISPNDHHYCYKCLIETDEEACKRCPPSMRTTSIWGMPPALYYSLYYTGYYSTYYSAYYSDIFTASPGIKMVRRKRLETNDVAEDPFYFIPVHSTMN